MSETYDVLVIGGGPAGLSAALMLGRCRRSVLVVDEGRPRNRSSPHMHGFLSRDGIPPIEFLEICRRDLQKYSTVRYHKGKVESLFRDGAGYAGILEDGSEVASRMVLLAMGIVDELPAVPNINEFYGRSVHHCPYCDGWEHQSKRIAVYGKGKPGGELAVEMRGWTENVIFCSNGEPIENSVLDLLAQKKIPVETAPIMKLEGEEGRLRAIHFDDGHMLDCEALFFAGSQKQHSGLAKDLGCELDNDGFVCCGEGVCTNVEGVYAAGNTASGLQLAIIAAAEGTKAAWAINQALLEKEV